MPTNDLVTWLRAQLDREEGDASLIPGGGYQPARWTAHRVPNGDWAEIRQHELPYGKADYEHADVSTAGLMLWGRNEDEHVARFDPARVTAELAAKRAIVYLHGRGHDCSGYDHNGEVDAYQYVPDGDCSTLRHLAAVYADRPGYQPEWAPVAEQTAD